MGGRGQHQTGRFYNDWWTRLKWKSVTYSHVFVTKKERTPFFKVIKRLVSHVVARCRCWSHPEIKSPSIVKMTEITFPKRSYASVPQSFTSPALLILLVNLETKSQLSVLALQTKMRCSALNKRTTSLRVHSCTNAVRFLITAVVSPSSLKPNGSGSWLLWSAAVCACRVCAARCHVGSLFTCWGAFREGVCVLWHYGPRVFTYGNGFAFPDTALILQHWWCVTSRAEQFQNRGQLHCENKRRICEAWCQGASAS